MTYWILGFAVALWAFIETFNYVFNHSVEDYPYDDEM